MEENKEELNDVVDQIIVEESNSVEETVESKKESKGLRFVKAILSGVFDQIIILAADLLIFFISGLILKLFGFMYVDAQKEAMFGLMYVITNILYYPIATELLKGKTIGRKILFR